MFLTKRIVKVVEALAAIRIRSTISAPIDCETTAQPSCGNEWSNVYPYTIIEIRIPAHRLFTQRLPADINIKGVFSVANRFQLLLQVDGGNKPCFSTGNTCISFSPLRHNP